MKRVNLLIIYLAMSLSGLAQAQTVLYAIDNQSNTLAILDPQTGAIQSTISITVAGKTIQSSNGLAVDPLTGKLYAAVKFFGSAGAGRNLLLIDPNTGSATDIGNMGQPIAGLAFDMNGTLYGVSGDCNNGCGGAATPETLFTVNTTTAVLTLFQTLGNGNDGEAIGYNPVDGAMYHMSGTGAGFIFEKIDLNTRAVTSIPLSGAPILEREAIGFTYDPNRDLFVGSLIDWVIGSGQFVTVSPTGFVTDVSNLSIAFKDYAFSVNVQVDTDLDGIPDDQDNCAVDFNPDQADNESDGVGDVCDEDDDNDGVPDISDAYPLGFQDVPLGAFAFDFIQTLALSGVTAGCGNANYCPDASVTRAQMAVFLERGINGSGYAPPPATGTIFADVPLGSFADAWIEQLFNDGITSGCGGGNYCPNDSVTRAQMAVFLLRAKYGAAYSPPPPTGIFADVPLGSFADRWIEQLAAEGITAGCGNQNYCPDDAVTRAQMAVFLVRTFGL